LATESALFERGVVVQLAHDQVANEPIAREVTPSIVKHLVHQRSRPYGFKRDVDGNDVERDVEFPGQVGVAYIDLVGGGKLRRLSGITSSPLLSDDGTIAVRDGYDAKTGMVCRDIPEVAVPERPTRAEAEAALMTQRRRFRTFAFADGETVIEDGVTVLDLT